MAEPRKVFRIEETAAMGLEPHHEDTAAALRHGEIMVELGALRAMLAAPVPQEAAATGADARQRAGFARLAADLNLIKAALGRTQSGDGADSGARPHTPPMARIAHELEAVMKGSEQATQKILAAAEEIDQAANNLSAALKSEVEQGLAQDILDRVIQIFEACNFQDLTSQRVAKVMATLDHIENQITHALKALSRADAAPSMHGPRLDGDDGHVAQSDIDTMFGGGVRSTLSGLERDRLRLNRSAL